MADDFKYISPREFQKLSAADKERYLAALFEVLHGAYDPLRPSPEVATEPKRGAAKAVKS